METIIQERAQISSDSTERKISGYGIVFDSDSAPMIVSDGKGKSVRVVERVTRQSVEGADMSDIICSFNHNLEKILGRTAAKTAKVTIDDTGGMYLIKAGNQSYATDLMESIERGDVIGSSFMFTYDNKLGYEFEERQDGTIVATFKKITKIIEMGPVVMPAYPETTAQNRAGELADAVKRYLGEKESELRVVVPEKNEAQKRALDIEEFYSIVCAAFYSQFDGKNGTYYYVKSIMVDNTLVAKEYPSNKMYKLSFLIDDAQDVVFDDKEQWIQVQKEYVPINRHLEGLEAEKRAIDNTQEQEKTIEYPFPAGYYRLKALSKRRV